MSSPRPRAGRVPRGLTPEELADLMIPLPRQVDLLDDSGLELDAIDLAIGSMADVGRSPPRTDEARQCVSRRLMMDFPRVVVFPQLEAQGSAGEDSSTARDPETARRISRALERLRQLGPCRPLGRPIALWQERLHELSIDFPNFEELIRTVVRPHLALIDAGIRHRMPAVLLVGPPGVGKTQFARSLQNVLDTPGLFLAINLETNSSALAGASNFWANSNPGRIFEILAWGSGGRSPVANPLVVLDEVDKVIADRYDPVAALYSLLEPETAARFEDQSLPNIEMDASYVRFILTANNLSAIPEPILSRLLQFDIRAPTPSEQRAIAARIYKDMALRTELEFDEFLCDEILVEAARLGPRVCKVRLNAALGIAFVSGLKRVDVKSWRQTARENGAMKPKMGFA